MPKILIVDDNEASRELFRAVLMGPGRQMLEASQGQEALVVIAREAPHLVLLDVEMPVMDGYAVLRAVRDDPRFATMRILAVTANAMIGAREKVLAAGFDGYISKPIRPAILRKEIEELLSSRGDGA